jgi:VCBS repeat-containing protein
MTMNCDSQPLTRKRCGAALWLAAGLASLLTAAEVAWAATPALVPVGDEGNASDATGYGAVGYAYRIGVNEVTRAEYAEFLNAVAATDAHGLYNPNMGILRSGSPGSYTYTATDGALSVAWVSWYDALRYANWLHNGQPSGAAGAASTEDGAYTFSGETRVSVRSLDAKAFLPDENEWYKAAYYQGGAEAWYWGYPTRSDTPPLATAPTVGNDNAANYDRSVSGVTPAGVYQATQGYYGTHDQAGNLWEWNETPVGSDRGLRGGSFDDYPLLLHTSYRDSQDPADENEFVGFRIAAAAEVVAPPNHAPVALADSYAMDEATVLAVAAPGVLANDSDADGNALTPVLETEPVHGTLALNADGSFTYTPAADYTGTDSFSYKPYDGIAVGDAVTVSLTVRPVFYALSVGNGSGDGSYTFGTVVTIQADAAPAGKVFDRWAGATAVIANVAAATTTLTMPRSAITVTATYQDAPAAIFDMTVAEWSSATRYLTVRGKGPAGKRVLLYDQNGLLLGRCTVLSTGTWEWRVRRLALQVPNRVRATCNGLTDEMPVTRK